MALSRWLPRTYPGYLSEFSFDLTVFDWQICRDIVVQLYTGFFPSNIIQTAQALFEYNFVPTASAISSITVGLSQSYYNQYKKAQNYRDLEIGNRLEVISQAAGVVTTIPSLSWKTEIAEQDSWLGNLIVSIPNVTFVSASDLTTWKKGFTDASTLLYRFSLQDWSGKYTQPGNHVMNWECYRCSEDFRALSTQAQVIANGALYAPPVIYPKNSM